MSICCGDLCEKTSKTCKMFCFCFDTPNPGVLQINFIWELCSSWKELVHSSQGCVFGDLISRDLGANFFATLGLNYGLFDIPILDPCALFRFVC